MINFLYSFEKYLNLHEKTAFKSLKFEFQSCCLITLLVWLNQSELVCAKITVFSQSALESVQDLNFRLGI